MCFYLMTLRHLNGNENEPIYLNYSSNHFNLVLELKDHAVNKIDKLVVANIGSR
jgi:hypothetical protein